MRKPRIYVAGPMKGRFEFNYAYFNDAADLLRANGWHVENPAAIGARYGTPEMINEHPTLLAAVMAADIHALETCDAIYLLEGWQNSVGAKKELAVALSLNMNIYLAPEICAPTVERGRT